MALTDNILAYWKFDDTSWSDSTGNGHSLTRVNDNNVSIGQGIINGDANFNGVNANPTGGGGTYLTTDGTFLSPGGVQQSEYSASVWVKTTTTPFVIETVTGSNWGGGTIALDINGQVTPAVWWGDNSGSSFDRFTAGPIVNDGNWHHIVFTWNAYGNLTLYVDGVLEHQQASAGNLANVDVNNISFNSNADGTYNTGSACEIDECGVWNRELTQAEVTALYNTGAGLTYPFGGNTRPAFIKFKGSQPSSSTLLTDILAYWKFDNDSWADSTGNGYNLTAVGTGVSIGNGIIDGDASFSGDGTFLTSDPNLPPSGLSQFSMAVWVKTTASNFDTFSSDPDGSGIQIATNWYGYASFGQVNGNNIGGPTSGDGAWHFVVLTYNSTGSQTLYVDGNLAQQITAPSSYNISVPFRFNASGLQGEVDEAGFWTRELSPTEVTALYNTGAGLTYPFDGNTRPAFIKFKGSQSSSSTLTDSILAYWNLDNDGSGGVSLVDSTGNSNTLTNNNGVTLGTGIIAGDAVFNGNNYLETTASFQDTTPLTLSAWIKYSGTGPWSGIGTGYPAHFRLLGIDGDLYFQAPDGATANTTGGAYNDGAWHYVVGVADGTNIYLYVDGSLAATTANSSTGTDLPFLIGNGGDFCSSDGSQIDEVGIWNRSLSSQEVADLYNSGAGLAYPFGGNTTPAFIKFR